MICGTAAPILPSQRGLGCVGEPDVEDGWFQAPKGRCQPLGGQSLFRCREANPTGRMFWSPGKEVWAAAPRSVWEYRKAAETNPRLFLSIKDEPVSRKGHSLMDILARPFLAGLFHLPGQVRKPEPLKCQRSLPFLQGRCSTNFFCNLSGKGQPSPAVPITRLRQAHPGMSPSRSRIPIMVSQ